MSSVLERRSSAALDARLSERLTVQVPGYSPTIDVSGLAKHVRATSSFPPKLRTRVDGARDPRPLPRTRRTKSNISVGLPRPARPRLLFPRVFRPAPPPASRPLDPDPPLASPPLPAGISYVKKQTASGDPEFNDLGPLPGFAPPGDADVTPTDAGLSGRMPSIPADGGFLEENDLMHLDNVLDFEVTDPALAASAPPPSGWVAAHSRGVSDSSGGGGDSDDWTGSGFSAGDEKNVGADLDPNDPKYKRRIQNRMASARFRAKAKERQLELDRLKHQVAQLRRERRILRRSVARLAKISRGRRRDNARPPWRGSWIISGSDVRCTSRRSRTACGGWYAGTIDRG